MFGSVPGCGVVPLGLPPTPPAHSSRPLPQLVAVRVQPPSGTRGSAHAHPPTWARPRGPAPRPPLRGLLVPGTCTTRGRRRPGRLPPARPCSSAAWVSRRALTPVIPSRCSHTAAPHLLPRPPPAHAEGDALSPSHPLPSWPGPPKTGDTCPAATAGGDRRLCSRGAPPAVPHSPPSALTLARWRRVPFGVRGCAIGGFF